MFDVRPNKEKKYVNILENEIINLNNYIKKVNNSNIDKIILVIGSEKILLSDKILNDYKNFVVKSSIESFNNETKENILYIKI